MTTMTSSDKSGVHQESLEEFSDDEDSSQRHFKDFQVVVNSKNQVVIKNFAQNGTSSSEGEKKAQAKKKKGDGGSSGGSSSNNGNNGKKFNHENYNKSIYIGTKNAERWDVARTKLKYKNDVEFVTFLLNLVEKYVSLERHEVGPGDRNSCSNSKMATSRNSDSDELKLNAARNDFFNHIAKLRTQSPTSSLHSSTTGFMPQPTNLKVEEFRAQDHSVTSTMEDFEAASGENVSPAAEILDYRIAEKIQNDLKERVSSLLDPPVVKLEGVKCENLEEEIPKVVVKKKKLPLKLNGGEKPAKGKSKVCWACGLKHDKTECPLDCPVGEVKDKVNLDIYKQICEATKLEKEEEGGLKSLPPYADASCPLELDVVEPTEETRHGASVIAKEFIPKFTRLGPLIGSEVVESDIADDSSMRFIFETFDGDKSRFFDVEDRNTANWVHYLRPAPTKEAKNLVLKVVDDEIFFVTTVDVPVGCELLYWSGEVNSAWTKKTSERTNCGGCNLKFSHPLYYRTHCSIFHDVGFSLTIKKYHCKICKISVLGKEQIMKHAETLHEGKGAYQCQFCKKFFLRLNYLDMHRTYGCSANPDRARPLCDFCGRKFCQPQKLKVHIKRMHSDLTDVLRDFQCKLCSKLLGSRAALQRHCKEVHNRESGFVNCPRCQKLFQNRSNLKIHMLTHSGVRPFKCAESDCTAAFTTKQCLQFHYKKVHGYTQEQMPKIERSVAYTFDAYSGGLQNDSSELDEKMFKPRKKRPKLSSSAPPPENLSDILNSCQEALELTRKHCNPKQEPCSMDASSNPFMPEDEDDDDYDDASTQDEENSTPLKIETPQPKEVKEVKPQLDALNLYRNLPSEEEEGNQTSNEDTTINDILESNPHPVAAQFPFNFGPPRPEEPPSAPQTNFNPLTSAFSAHPQTSFLNFFNNSAKNRLPTSAMLVEAALNSVSDASNEFIDSVTTEENNIDIESVPKAPPRNQPFSDNSVDEADFAHKGDEDESKKEDGVSFSVKKHFETSFEEERGQEFGACRQNFVQPTGQRDFYGHADNEPELSFALSHDYKKYDKCFQYLEEMKNLNETLKEQKRENSLSVESADCHFQKLKPDDLHKLLPNELDLKFKPPRKEEVEFRNPPNFNINTQMYSPLNFKSNNETYEIPANNSYNRYQHHIHDILSDKDPHQHAGEVSDQIHAPYLDHHSLGNHYDESLNLCKNTNPNVVATDYNSCMSPMPTHQGYSHDMLRNNPQDLCMGNTAPGGTSGGYMTTNNSPPAPLGHHHAPFLNVQHNNRDLDHRLLASAPDKFVASRLLVDPRFIEQQHRLLGGDIGVGSAKTMVAEQKSLGLSLYHQQLPTHQTSYHHEPVKATPNMHTNYHHLPFSAYYQ